MKRLTKSTVIGSKRKQQSDNKENEISLGHDNSNATLQSQLSDYKTPRPFCGVFQASLSTPLSVLTNDLTMESLTGSHTHHRVGRVLQPSLPTPNTDFTNENDGNNEPHIETEVGPSTTHACYTECITDLSKRPISRLMNANNPSSSDCRNLHNDFNECSEQENTVTYAQPGNISPHFCTIWYLH
nr:uncharacterized protein LOC109173751 [Ipomoea batatas]